MLNYSSWSYVYFSYTTLLRYSMSVTFVNLLSMISAFAKVLLSSTNFTANFYLLEKAPSPVAKADPSEKLISPRAQVLLHNQYRWSVHWFHQTTTAHLLITFSRNYISSQFSSGSLSCSNFSCFPQYCHSKYLSVPQSQLHVHLN